MDVILGVEDKEENNFWVYTYPKNPSNKKRKRVIHKFQSLNEKDKKDWIKAIENCAREGDVEIEARVPNLLFFINPFLTKIFSMKPYSNWLSFLIQFEN